MARSRCARQAKSHQMFRIEPKRKTRLMAGMEIAEVTYHATVRLARGNHSNALVRIDLQHHLRSRVHHRAVSDNDPAWVAFKHVPGRLRVFS